jgi:(S)-2-hydroxy-acid oxidase
MFDIVLKFLFTASSAIRTCMVLSCWSTTSLEDVASSSTGLKWFQIDILTNRNVMASLIKRAKTVGYKAIVLTLDMPVVGKRYKNFRCTFTVPPHPNLKEALQSENVSMVSPDAKHRLHDPSATWDTLVPWVKSMTSLPVVVKGILTIEDAKLAVKYGVDGIIVSNHGGRQLDCVPATVKTHFRILILLAFGTSYLSKIHMQSLTHHIAYC